MPIATQTTITQFSSLFRGRSSAYGIFNPSGDIDEHGKRKGSCRTTTGLLTQDLYAAHLAGQQSIGVVPITDTDTCFFGAIDVDEYSGEKNHLVSVIYKSGLPLCPFRSKSGGLHLFIFFMKDAAIPAKELIEILKEIRDLLGLSPKTEIFPKQHTSGNGIGNWINIPYFGDSDRVLLGPQGRAVAFEEAMRYCWEQRTNKEAIRRMLDDLAFSDGPPCLQSLALQGVTKARNNYLFSAARYFKTKLGDEEFPDALRELNKGMEDPIPEDELENTIIKSHLKKDYSYKCKDTPLCDICNKKKCGQRKYGVGNSEVSELDFGELVQIIDPVFPNADPTYKWTISGKVLTFYDERELTSQQSFQAQCIRFLHYKPSQMKNDKWDEIVNRALVNVKVRELDVMADMSSASKFRECLVEFLTDRATARVKDRLLSGRVFFDTDLNAYIFLARDFAKFLSDVKKFTIQKSGELADMLKALGGEVAKYKVNDLHPNVSVWKVPKEKLTEYIMKSSGSVSSEDIEREMGMDSDSIGRDF